MKTVPETTVSSWKKLRDVLEELANAGWAFRGQANTNWPLESSLTRHLRNFVDIPADWLARERKILKTFKRKAHLLLSRTPEPRETLEWLALMQHHGAPTRLLDFTWSPYVAAFFALERATDDAAIWAISSGRAMPNFRGSHISKILNQLLELDNPEAITRKRPSKFDKPTGHGSPSRRKHIPPVMIGEPVLMNERMTSQAGTFVIPTKRLGKPIESLVPASSILKVRLATAALRKETMDRLYNMNINNATLFPGIDGLARSLAFELEFEWAVDPHAARRLVKSMNRTAFPRPRSRPG
jgi:FRG domain